MFINIMFYIVWAILAFFPLVIAILVPENIKEKIIACLCVLIITCVFSVFMYKDGERANNRWNNGICKCGGTYRLCAASRTHMSKLYYYTCDTCGHTEEFSHLMK